MKRSLCLMLCGIANLFLLCFSAWASESGAGPELSEDPLEADRLGPSLDALGASGFTGSWGILLTRVPRGKLGAAMTTALKASGLKVLGLIPAKVEYERSFGHAPSRLEDYASALEEFLA